jgi:alpha-tubulin suppressor-like RCC1 family protein
VAAPDDEELARVSVGAGFGCGLRTSDGSIVCWGHAGNDAIDCRDVPMAGQLEAPAGSFTDIDSGRLTTCAIDAVGSLACWGAGESGDDPVELCEEDLYNYGQAVPPPGVFGQVDVSFRHACGVRTDGTLACWGFGTVDECVPETGSCRQSLPPPGVFGEVATGLNHSCAMTAERKVQCWGYDGEGDVSGRTTTPAVFQ